MSVNRFADALRHGMELSESIDKGEPVYRFVVGTGWVPSFGPVEMTVSERGLQVGDVIMGWHHTGNPSMYRPGVEYIVTKVSGDTISTVTHPGFYIINGSVQAFLVRR